VIHSTYPVSATMKTGCLILSICK